MLLDRDYKVYEAMSFQWEPGRQVRERLRDEYELRLSAPVFYNSITRLEDEGFAERKHVPTEVKGHTIDIPHVKKLPGCQRPRREPELESGLDGLVLVPG